MASIKTRIAVLAEDVRRWKQQHDTPYEALDPLSQAMTDFAGELAALDEQGKAELLAELNRDGAGMTREDLEQMIRSITVDY